MSNTDESTPAGTPQAAPPASTEGSTPSAAPTKKATTKKATTKKATTKKATTKKATTKKATTKKATAKKATAKKRPTTRSSTKKTVPSQGPAALTAHRAAATGRAVAARAASVSQKPVEASRALAARAGDGVAYLGRSVRIPSTQFFARAPVGAQAIVADPDALRGLADKVLHSESGRSGPLGEVVDDFRTLGRLVGAYARGEYRDIPFDSLLMVIAGLVYVVSPIDLVPDAVPVAGYADDVVAVGFVIRQVHHELAAFREWESTVT
jgi:uncharacterized membrane protein YkvA (DUF1232 family)